MAVKITVIKKIKISLYNHIRIGYFTVGFGNGGFAGSELSKIQETVFFHPRGYCPVKFPFRDFNPISILYINEVLRS